MLELLEYMSDDRREVKVMDVSRALGYPQSSTSELLGSLVHLGYLHLDRSNRTFRATARIAALGRQVQPKLFGKGAIVELSEEAARRFGCAVVVAMLNHSMLELVYACGFDRPLSRLVRPCPLRCSMGKALLAGQSDEAIRALVHRRNAEETELEPVRASAFLEEIEQVRSTGHACSPSAAPGHQTLSIALPCDLGDPLCISLLLPDHLEGEAISAITRELRTTVDDFLLANRVVMQTGGNGPVPNKTPVPIHLARGGLPSSGKGMPIGAESA